MKNENPDKRDIRLQQGAANDENISQEEVLNMDELFDLQGGVDDQLKGNCGLGCFTGATMHQSSDDKPSTNE